MTESSSASSVVAVAVSVAFVPGEWSSSDTVAVGAVFSTVTGAEVSGADVSEPSETVTRTRIASPRSPLPADRSRVAPVAPPMSVPFTSTGSSS